MPSPEQLIAHYLKTNNLIQTLRSFELELNQKFDYSVDESLETILKDRYEYLSLQSLDLKSTVRPEWTVDIPQTQSRLPLGNMGSLVIYSSSFSALVGGQELEVAVFVTNDREVHMFDLVAQKKLANRSDLHGSTPTKLAVGIDGTNVFLSCGMDGKMRVWKVSNESFELELLAEEQIHQRLILDLKYHPIDKNTGYTISIGWDRKLTATIVDLRSGSITKLNSITLMTKGTCIHTSTDKSGYPLILVGRTDTSMVGVFTIADMLFEIGRIALNDSEFSSHSFQPMQIVTTYSGSAVVATNHVPYMRLITLEIPTIANLVGCGDVGVSERLKEMSLTATDTESFQSDVTIKRNIIISNYNSMSPQDKFSEPIILARPQKLGVWVCGDDGVLRGFDLGTGVVAEELQTHESRIKSAFITSIGGKETVVTSGALDRVIKEWK